jgi:hypothetical protein
MGLATIDRIGNKIFVAYNNSYNIPIYSCKFPARITFTVLVTILTVVQTFMDKAYWKDEKEKDNYPID